MKLLPPAVPLNCSALGLYNTTMILYTYSTLELLRDSTCTFGLDNLDEVLPTLLILTSVAAILIFPLLSLPNRIITILLGLGGILTAIDATNNVRDRSKFGSPHHIPSRGRDAPHNIPQSEQKPESSGSNNGGSTENTTQNSGQDYSPDSKVAVLFPFLPVYLTVPNAELTDLQLSGSVMFYCSITCLVCAYLTLSLLLSVVVYQHGVKAFNLEDHPLIAKFFPSSRREEVSYPLGVFTAVLTTCLLVTTALTLYLCSQILA